MNWCDGVYARDESLDKSYQSSVWDDILDQIQDKGASELKDFDFLAPGLEGMDSEVPDGLDLCNFDTTPATDACATKDRNPLLFNTAALSSSGEPDGSQHSAYSALPFDTVAALRRRSHESDAGTAGLQPSSSADRAGMTPGFIETNSLLDGYSLGTDASTPPRRLEARSKSFGCNSTAGVVPHTPTKASLSMLTSDSALAQVTWEYGADDIKGNGHGTSCANASLSEVHVVPDFGGMPPLTVVGSLQMQATEVGDDSPKALPEEGALSRLERLQRYREKKHRRLFQKRVLYHMRKVNADKRPRIKGRFVTAAELAKYKEEHHVC